jgi:hypothetical protein
LLNYNLRKVQDHCHHSNSRWHQEFWDPPFNSWPRGVTANFFTWEKLDISWNKRDFFSHQVSPSSCWDTLNQVQGIIVKFRKFSCSCCTCISDTILLQVPLLKCHI